MRSIIVIALAGASLGGCSSFSTNIFKSTPPTVQVQLESQPSGADAKTSLGPDCKTPCSVSVTAPDNGGGFSVTYTLDKYEPATVPVQVVHTPGDLSTPATTTTDPNPVFAELQPVTPPKAHKRLKQSKKPKTAKTAAAPAAAASPFPEPGTAAPPPAAPSH